MTSVLAIVSKALFDKAIKGQTNIGPGKVLDFDRYTSANKNLEQLAEGGALFMVTVRPPDERLWLVAILESPQFDGKEWIAKKNAAPIADITDLIPRLEFTSGKGIQAKKGKRSAQRAERAESGARASPERAPKGALGMSLQTPRGLTDKDIGLLRTAVASGSEMDVRALLSGELIHLNAHEPDVVPCLCRDCIDPDVVRAEAEGESYLREYAVAKGRVLFFWMPESLEKDKKAVRRAVEARLHGKLDAR